MLITVQYELPIAKRNTKTPSQRVTPEKKPLHKEPTHVGCISSHTKLHVGCISSQLVVIYHSQ